jgi:galactitol-specific phosphotransferase system IIB component
LNRQKNINTIIIFNKTFRYLKSPEDYFTNNDIIELFDKDEDKAIIEFNKINDFKHILYIYRKINKINKKEILFNKIEDYMKNNKDDHIGTFLYEAISILFPTIKDTEIKKKYGIILLKYSPDYDIFIIIKPLCNELEMQEILTNIENNIDNDDYIDNNILNILCDYKSYDKIYDLIIDMMDDFDKIVKYCNLLKEHMPDKISIILKKNIEKILDSGNPNYYVDSIEYLKIYKETVSNDDFISYTNDLVKKHGRKTKFKKLFNDRFK